MSSSSLVRLTKPGIRFFTKFFVTMLTSPASYIDPCPPLQIIAIEVRLGDLEEKGEWVWLAVLNYTLTYMYIVKDRGT